jgi:GNAT superfamily N-acetyltransferase
VSGSPDGPPGPVRLATADDAEAIAGVHVRSWRAAYRGVVPDVILDSLSVELRAAWWRSTISEAGEARVWVVGRSGTVEGFAATGPARDDDLPPGAGEVHAIYLDPPVWSTGLGRLLFGAAVADLDGRGFAPLLLWVLSLNPRGRRFYEAAGWRMDGTSRLLDFDGTLIEETRYRKRG